MSSIFQNQSSTLANFFCIIFLKIFPILSQYSPVLLLQPPPVPVVSRFPEPVYGRPRELDIMEELDSTTGAGLPNLPIAYNRIKLPPLQVTSATLGSTNITSSLSVINNPKPMNSISENSRGKGSYC